jgi:hypothetical protein
MVLGSACALARPRPAVAGTQVGVFGGASQYGWKYPETPADVTLQRLLGPIGGIKLRFSLRHNVSLVIEGAYARKGQKLHSELEFHSATIWTGWKNDLSFELHYLDIPAFLQLSLGSGRVKPYIFGGPVFGYLARARERDTTVDYKNGAAGPTHDFDEPATDDFRSTELSIAGGAGARFGRVFAEAIYMHGLSNIDPDGDAADALKNRGFELRLGFELGRR